VLKESVRPVILETAGGPQEMQCLPLKHIPGWLFGVSAARVKAELYDKILLYRRECFEVLWRAFAPDIVAAPPAGASLSGAALALEIATAIQHLAQQQLALEGQLEAQREDLEHVRGKQEVMATYMRGFVRTTQDRLNTLELQLAAEETITEAQAAEISLAVKNIGQVLATRGDRAGYSAVYAELYRRYRISGYKNLPARQYGECLAWLHAWYQEVMAAGAGK